MNKYKKELEINKMNYQVFKKDKIVRLSSFNYNSEI